jgi:pimeloyl-ACP methyl ester carboxylesterase
MIKPRSSFIDVNDIRLHYLEWDPAQFQSPSNLQSAQDTFDDDAIPLVMIHGLGATADTWQLVAKHLYKHHSIIAFDLRGHGLSDQPESGYDLVTMAEDLIGGMAALGLGQVALVGHGWGARVALVLAARHPALVSHLVLVDCPHIEPRHWPGMTRDRFLKDREKTYPDTYASMNGFVQAMRDEIGDGWSPEVATILSTYVRELSDGTVEERLRPEHQRQIREALWDDRALDYYGKLTCPVLLVPAAAHPQPGEEPPERLEQADEFAAAKGYMAMQVARAIHNCSVHWMPDTAHDIQLQRPEILAATIAAFIDEK